MDDATHGDLMARVRQIAGHVIEIERALRTEANWAEILHLIGAVRGAADGLMDKVLAEHLKAHGAQPGLSADGS